MLSIDNLYRTRLLYSESEKIRYNWNRLSNVSGITLIEADVRDADLMIKLAADAEVIIHAAGQTTVTHSVVDPKTDFLVNAAGTFNMLEAARKSGKKPSFIYCSTNKVYGDNVNNISVEENENRYSFQKSSSVKETMSIDHCKHSPYGCSKLTGDLYVQDYAKLYGMKTGVFRMSCIYGPHQFGFEDQGWVVWFIIAALTGQKINIFGDGKQVRDILWIDDLIDLWIKFLHSPLTEGVFNTGGGTDNTLSLIELLDIIKKKTGKDLKTSYSDWRPGDQKVYISNIEKVCNELNWKPSIQPEEGIQRIISWVENNIAIFR